MAPRHYDVCTCGRSKKRTSTLCLDCSHASRRTPQTELRRSRRKGALDYFTKNGRYSLLAVSGYANYTGGMWATTFSVLDGHDCFREVKRVVASERNVDKKRQDLIAWIRDREWAERVTA